MERPLTVGQLARATGVPAKTIRYYEQVGVLLEPRRSEAGYRHYSRHDVHRLLFIRRARALGLSLANLKALTAELDSGECLTMRPRLHALVTEQLRTVQQQIAEFQLLERQLVQVLQRLQTAAPAPHADGCRCLDSGTPAVRPRHSATRRKISGGRMIICATGTTPTSSPGTSGIWAVYIHRSKRC